MDHPKNINVAVVDDHEIFREGFIRVIESFKGIKVIYHTDNGNDLILKFKDLPIDVIILDINMPVLNGIDIARKIREVDKNIRIIMLTMYNEESFIIKSVEAKVNGYLVKTSKPSEVNTAIRMVASEGVYYGEYVQGVLMKDIIHKNQLNPLDQEPYVQFDEKELKVLRLLCQEKTSTQIGKELFKSKFTIDRYRANLLKKTNTHTTAGLILFCIKNKLL